MQITQPVPSPTSQTSSVAAIETIELCKSFGVAQAVDHLSLSIRQGEVFGLLGPNGSGKTTTINMISGLSIPTQGDIRILGYNVRRDIRHIRRLLGVVPQETALYEELTAWDNLDFHADLYGVPRQKKLERITAVLAMVQLTDRKHSRVGTFSGGMKRRLALGRALLHEPRILYLDEPTLGVDVQARRAIWDHVLSLRNQGKTILITTNYLEEAQAICDRLAIIDHGRLIAVDTPEHLKRSYGGSIIELETMQPTGSIAVLQALEGVQDITQDDTHLIINVQNNSNVVPQIINILSQEGEIRDIAMRESTLDEVFLHLTGTALRD